MRLSNITEASLEWVDEEAVDKIVNYTVAAILAAHTRAREEWLKQERERNQTNRRYSRPDSRPDLNPMDAGIQELKKRGFGEKPTIIGSLKNQYFDDIEVVGMHTYHGSDAYALRGWSGSGGCTKTDRRPYVLINLHPVGLIDEEFDENRINRCRFGIRELIYHELRHVRQTAPMQYNRKAANAWTRLGRSSPDSPPEIDAVAVALARMYQRLPQDKKKRIRSYQDLIRLMPAATKLKHDNKRAIMHKIAKLIDLN
jgi:hypothetical protein